MDELVTILGLGYIIHKMTQKTPVTPVKVDKSQLPKIGQRVSIYKRDQWRVTEAGEPHTLLTTVGVDETTGEVEIEVIRPGWFTAMRYTLPYGTYFALNSGIDEKNIPSPGDQVYLYSAHKLRIPDYDDRTILTVVEVFETLAIEVELPKPEYGRAKRFLLPHGSYFKLSR